MLPPGQPTLLVGAMHAGEIDTVLDQSVKATADVDLWHLADIPEPSINRTSAVRMSHNNGAA